VSETLEIAHEQGEFGCGSRFIDRSELRSGHSGKREDFPVH
jgi:hypothetical protein